VKYFFDTNVISKLVKKDEAVIAKLKNITKEGSEFYINKLVYMESLRAIPITHEKLFKLTKETLDNFVKLNISEDIYKKSVDFARVCKSKGINFGKCEAIDYLHFITAKEYGLEIVSFDKDMEIMEAIYTEYMSE